MQHALVFCQIVVVIFLVFHDWVPLGKLNNIPGLRAVDTTSRLGLTTTISTLPFAAVLVASILLTSVEYTFASRAHTHFCRNETVSGPTPCTSSSTR